MKNLLQEFFHRGNEVSSALAYSYSQEGEDLVLKDLMIKAGINPEKIVGSFVDVGAHHPLRFSNTNLFYEWGWRGINFEPNPGAIALFEEARPQDTNFGIAVGRERKTATFFLYNESALNGIDNDRTEELRNTAYELEGTVAVEVFPLCEKLKEVWEDGLPGVAFLTLDVEGYELEVLEGNDWEKFRFDFVLVEQKYDDLTRISDNPVHQFLEREGYKACAATGRTVFYRKRSIPDRER